jgi:hypothetical protein
MDTLTTIIKSRDGLWYHTYLFELLVFLLGVLDLQTEKHSLTQVASWREWDPELIVVQLISCCFSRQKYTQIPLSMLQILFNAER